MSYNKVRNETEWKLDGGQLVDLSDPSVSYVAVPFKGVLTTAYACIATAITVASCVVTVQLKSGTATARTLGTITLTVGGGRVFEIAMTGTESARSATAGDTLIFDSDGGSSTTSIANFVGVFKGM